MQGVFLRKYGVETKVDFVLFGTTGVDFKSDAAHAAGDTTVMKDEGAEASTTNAFVDEGQGYSITLTATEMQAARVVVYVVDQGTKAWLDTAIVIETYGNASAMHAMDFDDAVRGGLTALPNAAANAAGGLPISDAGGLDIDTKLANTNEVSAARMGALTDWIDGGRLDLLIDTLLSRVSANVALASVCTETRLAELDAANLPTDIATATAYIDTEVDAIPTTAEITAAIEALATYKKMLAANIGAITDNEDGTYTYKNELGAAIFTFTISGTTRTRADA